MEEFIVCQWGEMAISFALVINSSHASYYEKYWFKQVITPFTQFQPFYFIEKSKSDFALFFCKFPCYSASISIATVSRSHF